MYKAILCDDEVEKANVLRDKVLPGCHIELEHVGNVDALLGRLSKTEYDLVLLDLHYPDDSGDDVCISTIDAESVREASQSAKLAICTGQDTEVTRLLMKELFSRRLIDHWFSESDIFDSPDKMQIEIQSMLGIKDLVAGSDGLWVLHLSDIHFPNTFTFREEPINGSRLSQLISTAILNLAKGNVKFQRPHLVILSGDFSHTGVPSEFEQATLLVDKIVDNGELAEDFVEFPIVLVEGNHDLNWDLSMLETHGVVRKGKNLTVQAANEGDPWKLEMKWHNYLNFSRSVKGRSIKAEFPSKWTVSDFEADLGIGVITINSCRNIRYNNLKSMNIDFQDLEEIADLPDRSNWNVLVVHHSLTSIQPDVSKRQELVRFMVEELQVKLILRGHTHQSEPIIHAVDGGIRLLELGGGSLAAAQPQRPGEEPASFAVLRLHRGERTDLSMVDHYRFEFAANRFAARTQKDGELFERIDLINP